MSGPYASNGPKLNRLMVVPVVALALRAEASVVVCVEIVLAVPARSSCG